MRVPLVPNVSLRWRASQMDARVFSSAQTPARPEGPQVLIMLPNPPVVCSRFSGVSSIVPRVPKKSSCRYGTGRLCMSPEPMTPNLYGLTPSCSSSTSPIL